VPTPTTGTDAPATPGGSTDVPTANPTDDSGEGGTDNPTLSPNFAESDVPTVNPTEQTPEPVPTAKPTEQIQSGEPTSDFLSAVSIATWYCH
jgi:hypothetical protein